MEIEAQLLEDLLEFLRILEDVELPPKFHTSRARLVGRVQAAVSAAENYIHMKPGKPLDYDSAPDNSSEDYVTPDKQPPLSASFLFKYQHRSRQQCLSDCSSTSSFTATPIRPPTYLMEKNCSTPPSVPPDPQPTVVAASKLPEITGREKTSDCIVEIYDKMSAAVAESKADMSGQLRRKERIFFFDTLRSFWAALVGFHLLSYDNRNDPAPSQIIFLKGCTCGPVSSSPRNAKKQLEAAFEISFEDDRTFQFTASGSQQMEEWVAAIRQSEANSRDVTDVFQIRTWTSHTIKEEGSSENTDAYEEYEDVIPDIAKALANPGQFAKPNGSRSPVGQEKPKPLRPAPALKPKPDAQNKSSINQVTVPKRIDRVLPPPPPENLEEDLVYNEIGESDEASVSPDLKSPCENEGMNYSIPTEEDDDQDGQIYDDIQLVKQAVGRMAEAKKINLRELEKTIPSEDEEIEEQTYDDIQLVKQVVGRMAESKKINLKELEKNIPPEDEEIEEQTYDDVVVVKRKVQKFRENGSVTREPTEVDEERKPVTETPKQPIKVSPIKGLLGRLRLRNISPQKEEAKKKTPEPPGPSIPKEIPPAICSEESDSYVNNQILKDLSTYNNPPPPRPVHDESIPGEDSDEVEESIYDDVGAKDAVKKEISPEVEAEKRKKMDYLVAGFKTVVEAGCGRPSPNPKPQRNVVRNLNKSYEDEIYQNETGDGNIEDCFEHYQVPRGDANLQAQSSSKDDDTDNEQIYDDAAIAAQKKREIEETKEKPAVRKLVKNFGVPVLPKSNENSLFNRINKFSLSVAEKSTTEKKIQNRFIKGKRPKVQENDKPLDNRIIMAGDNELYDDCQINGSLKSQVK